MYSVADAMLKSATGELRDKVEAYVIYVIIYPCIYLSRTVHPVSMLVIPVSARDSAVSGQCEARSTTVSHHTEVRPSET